MNSSRASPSEAAAVALLNKATDAQLDKLCLVLDLPTQEIPRGARAPKALAIWNLAKRKGDATLALLEEDLCLQLGHPPPAYELYFSCSETERADPLCAEFFADLTAQLRSQWAAAGQPPSGEVRFFDESNAEDPEVWFPWSLHAMRRCRALVCLYSRAYFSDAYCGRVWSAFSDRLKSYHQARAGAGALPQLILPVLWKPLSELPKILPKAARDPNVPYLAPGAPYDTGGLQALVGLAKANRENSRQSYNYFVDALARRLVAAAQADPLPETSAIPPLSKIPSAFYIPFQAVQAEQEKGTEYAKFVLVAARKADIQTLRDAEAYDLAPELWRPYHPISSEKLGIISTQEAAKANMMAAFIPLDSDFLKNFDSAAAGGNIILVLIDPWTLQLQPYGNYISPHYQKLLEQSTVLVCWNDEDSETKNQRQNLVLVLDQIFPKKLSTRYPDKFRNDISSVPRLRAELADALLATRRAIVDETNNPKVAQGLAFVRPDSVVAPPAQGRNVIEPARKAEGNEGTAFIQPRIEGPSGATEI